MGNMETPISDIVYVTKDRVVPNRCASFQRFMSYIICKFHGTYLDDILIHNVSFF